MRQRAKPGRTYAMTGVVGDPGVDARVRYPTPKFFTGRFPEFPSPHSLKEEPLVTEVRGAGRRVGDLCRAAEAMKRQRP